MSFGGINTFDQYSNDFGLGHNGVKISLNYFDGIPEPSLLNALHNNELKLTFKSLMKRDETTKEKALADLIPLINEQNITWFNDDIFPLCWSQIYAKLIVCDSKNIRIASHKITLLLIKLLGKYISKFLPDLIPFVLMGTCDSDSLVANNTKTILLECFSNKVDKVDALWCLFFEQTLQLLKDVVLVQNSGTLSDERHISKENSDLRFNRLLLNSILELNQLLQKNDLEKVSDCKTLLKEILTDDKLWQSLSLKNSSNYKSFEALLTLLNILFQKDYLFSNKSVLKSASKKLLKSLAQVNSKNINNVSFLLPSLLNILGVLATYKDGKIWSYDKSSKDKLLNILNVSAEHSYIGFFSSMYHLSKNNELLDTEKDWLPLWKKALKALSERPFLGRFGAKLYEEFWVFYIKCINDSEDLENASTIIENDIIVTLHSKVDFSELPQLLVLLSKHITAGTVSKQLETLFWDSEHTQNSKLIKNLLVLLLKCENNEDTIHKFMDGLSSYISDTIGITKDDHFSLILKTIGLLLQSDCMFLEKDFNQFFFKIPEIFEKESFDDFSNLFIKYSKSKFASNANSSFVTILNDYFASASMMEIPSDKIISVVNSLSPDYIKLLMNLPESSILELMESWLKSYKFEDDGLFLKGNMINDDIVKRIYETSIENGSIDDLCGKLGLLNVKFQKTLILETSFLEKALFNVSSESTKELLKLCHPLLKENYDLASQLANIIISNVSGALLDKENYSIALDFSTQIINENIGTLTIFLPEDIQTYFESYVKCLDKNIPLVNSMGLNSLILSEIAGTVQQAALRKLLHHSIFIDDILTKLPVFVNDELIVLLTICSEVASDFNSISESPDDSFFDIKHTLLKDTDFNVTVEDITSSILPKTTGTNEAENLALEILFDNSIENSTFLFYQTCVLAKLINNNVDNVSNSSLQQIVPRVEKFIASVIRSKVISNSECLKSSLLLFILEKLNSSSELSKLRTLIASELIGLKTQDVTDNKYKILLLLNNTLLLESPSEDFIAIAPQRLTMIFKSINQWLDSDIAYEPEFIDVRLALINFFSLLVKIPGSVKMTPSILDMSIKIVADSLTMCQLEDTPKLLVLRELCLELLTHIKVHYVDILQDSEYYEEIVDGLLQCIFMKFTGEANNQISSIFYRGLNNLTSNFKDLNLREKFDDLLESFIKKDAHINQVRLLGNLLGNVIEKKQVDAVIEFEFKSKSNDEDEKLDVSDEFNLPKKIIDKLINDVPQDYLEYENESSFIKYLWSWKLILCHFKDISYNLRQHYLNELKKDDLIKKMLSFCSDQIDLQDKEFWGAVTAEELTNYNITENDFSPYKERLVSECKILLGNILYEIFNNVGSMSNSWWINIKDKSLQKKIETFVIQFVSPVLINNELSDVMSKVDNLTKNNDSLTIKINKTNQEVNASYLIDEQRMKINFKLPINYPLENIKVTGISRVGISEQKWKQWIMSTQRVITGMNGSVMDCLELFTKNVTLQFSGFEECAICYSILHAVDRKLPSKSCPTCNNKYHGACLYKWFRSSGNNTCPMCRGEIPFRR